VASHRKLLDTLLVGRSDANIRFDEMRRLLSALGFHERVRGDHHIYWRDGIEEIINLQPQSGKSNPIRLAKSDASSRNMIWAASNEE
jgi:predicted RNA binding protein YcfA (HicA-like mRNA interferase family)